MLRDRPCSCNEAAQPLPTSAAITSLCKQSHKVTERLYQQFDVTIVETINMTALSGPKGLTGAEAKSCSLIGWHTL